MESKAKPETRKPFDWSWLSPGVTKRPYGIGADAMLKVHVEALLWLSVRDSAGKSFAMPVKVDLPNLAAKLEQRLAVTRTPRRG